MIFFSRCISNILINVALDRSLYQERPRVFDSIFRSFARLNGLVEGRENAYTYYILDGRSSHKAMGNHYASCNPQNTDWFFVLTSKLEIFFAEALKCTVLHSSCVRINDKNILLMGERFAGKTSLTKYLSIDLNGEYLDDDCVYIVENAYLGFCLPLPMRNVMLPRHDEYSIGQTTDEDDIVRTLYAPANYVTCLRSMDMIAFLEYNQNGTNSIRKLKKMDAFNKVITNIRSHGDMKTLFTDINHLLNGAHCFALQYVHSDWAYNMLFEEKLSVTRDQDEMREKHT